MNLSDILLRVKLGVDRLAEMLIPPGSALSTGLLKAGLYVLVFVGLPLLILVSLPYGVGIILLIAVVLLFIFGLPGGM
jgi:hypothetical protein